MNESELWARLREKNLVSGDLPPPPADPPSPWFVRVMLGCAGWIGALFLLGFLGVGFSFLFKNAGAAWVLGGITCAAATLVFRVTPENIFVGQFAFALSLAGQALATFGTIETFEHQLLMPCLVLAVQQAALFVAIPQLVHRTWCAWTATFALAVVLWRAGFFALTPALTTAAFVTLALAEFKLGRGGDRMRGALYGVALATLQLTVLRNDLWNDLIDDAPPFQFAPALLWTGCVATIAVVVLAVGALLRRERVPLGSPAARLALFAALLLGLTTLKAPGLAPAMLVLLLGFANSNRVLTGLGLLATAGYLAHYYYSLESTLLAKAALLGSFGLVLVLAHFPLKYLTGTSVAANPEARHA